MLFCENASGQIWAKVGCSEGIFSSPVSRQWSSLYMFSVSILHVDIRGSKIF